MSTDSPTETEDEPQSTFDDVEFTTDDTTLFDSTHPVNDEPYVAMLLRENEDGITLERELVVLGTDFESLEEITDYLQARLNGTSPSNRTFDLEFVPTKAEIYGMVAAASFERTTRPFAVSIETEVYALTASSPQNARYKAAAQHKKAFGGPEVGLSVDDYADIAIILNDLDE